MRLSCSSSSSIRPPRPRSDRHALWMRPTVSSGERGSSTSTRQRDSSAALSSKEGFSVVAPMSSTSPRSTKGRKASCCALLKRWISSTNSSVRSPVRARRSRASLITARTSLTPERTAEKGTKRAPLASATRRARVVLPTPGGPQRRRLCWTSPSRTRWRSFPSPSRCDWPKTSPASLGRMRSASGASAGAAATGSSRSAPPGSESSKRAALMVIEGRQPLVRRWYGGRGGWH